MSGLEVASVSACTLAGSELAHVEWPPFRARQRQGGALPALSRRMKTGLLQWASAKLAQTNRRTILVLSVALLLLIGWLDYVTTVELSLLTFYWIPVALATWYNGRRAGYWVATASVVIAVGTDIASGVAHKHFFLLWDFVTRLVSFLIFVWMLAKLKELYEEAKKATQLEIELHSSQAAYRELQAFSYIISHNLHAPLRSIDGYSHLVLERYAGQLDEEGKQLLQNLRQSSQQMARLIDALLELMEISGGELRHEPVDLSALAESIGAELKQKHPYRAVQFVVQPGMFVIGDRRLLQTALQCLLDNAWKFTERRSDASITLGVTRQDGRLVYFVRDNGAGFSMAYADKLFTPFQSVHRRGEFEGLGVGLPIADRLIRRHGGRIWAEGIEGRGATFYFTLEREA